MNEIILGYPHGLPLYWKNEASGKLSDAVMAFFDIYDVDNPNKPDELTSEKISLIRSYLSYYLKAPCWQPNDELNDVIIKAFKISSRKDIETLINDCLHIGLDPF